MQNALFLKSESSSNKLNSFFTYLSFFFFTFYFLFIFFYFPFSSPPQSAAIYPHFSLSLESRDGILPLA